MNPTFIPLVKVDVAKREVWGRATQEIRDKDNEVLDYEQSKPVLLKWSDEFSKATDGKSLGNVRAMHGKVAAGKLIAFDANDAEKAFDVGVKVVDDAEWNKVLEGVYTGFSFGGTYAKRWTDPGNPALTRYVPKPSELSLVDSPCVPTARFVLVKADGSTEQKGFIAPAAADDDSAGALAKLTPEGLATVLDAVVAKAVDGVTEKVTGAVLAKIAARSDTDPAAGKKEYGDVSFADMKNHKYPLDNEGHVRAALSYWGKSENRAKYSSEDQKTITDKIHAAAKRFGIDVQKLDDAAELTKLFEGAEQDRLAKEASRAQAIHDHAVAMGASCASDKMLKPEDLAKADSHASRIQAIHDHAAAMGAQHAAPDDNDADDAGKGVKSVVEKMAAGFQKQMEKMAAALDAATEANKALTERLEKLEAQPARPKGLKVIGRDGKPEPLGKSTGPVSGNGDGDAALEAIREVHGGEPHVWGR